MPVVKFHVVDVDFKLQQKTIIKQFIKYIFSTERKRFDAVDIIFCSDEHLLSLNQQFLQHNYYTDILTFDLSEDSEVITGEIYISVDRVKDNASSSNLTFTAELQRVIFHGILHLCGYLDKTKVEKELMTRKEDFYLKQYESFHVETK